MKMKLSDFFVSCSGANKKVLEECPTEKTKFVGIGSTIFFTALLASISGGYAIFFTFNSLIISILFGMIWGLVIFSLDRYIVTSINKPKLPSRADLKIFEDEQPETLRKKTLLKMERSRLIWRQFWSAFPRILIALVLAITISKPLEIKLFDGTITRKLGETESAYNRDCESNFNIQRMGLENQKQLFKNELEKSRNTIYLNDPIFKDLLNQQDDIKKTNSGLQGNLQSNNNIIRQNTIHEKVLINKENKEIKDVIRYTDLARLKMKENQNLVTQINTNTNKLNMIVNQGENRKTELVENIRLIEKGYTKQIDAVQLQINDLNSRREYLIGKCRQESAADKDILSRLRALGELKQFGNSVFWASLLITLLFMLLETAPITVKLLSNRGPYDDIIDKIEITNKLKQALQITKVRNEIKYNEQESKMKFDLKIKSDEELIKSSYVARQDITNLMIEKWKDHQAKELLDLYTQEEQKLQNKLEFLYKEQSDLEMKKEEVDKTLQDIELIKDEIIVITDEDIRIRAEEIWRTRNQGDDVLNWKLAQEELKQEFRNRI